MFAKHRSIHLPTFSLALVLFVLLAAIVGFTCPLIVVAHTDSLKKPIVDAHGAIIRGNLSEKTLTLVFTGDHFADGGDVIRKTLNKHKIKGAFFLTGNFYDNPAFANLIRGLRGDGHYLGAHSDSHLLYADWTKRDSLLVTEQQFQYDLERNYRRMESFGITFADAPYFLPPYEWYNKTIAGWTQNLGLKLVNYTPGTRSAADYTFPEMGSRYLSSHEIYSSILQCEERDPHGLNGFMLLVHIGTDPRRTDKFYGQLDKLIVELKSRGYSFVGIDVLLSDAARPK